MSLLRDEVRKCCTARNVNAEGLPSASFCFAQEFSGFRGHFPGNPILPAICMVQAALVVLADWRSRPCRMREMKQSKFLSRVTPGDAIDLVCRKFTDGEDESAAMFAITSDGRRVADVSMLVAFGHAEDSQTSEKEAP